MTRANIVKSVFKFTPLLFVLLNLVGCVSSGVTRNASPITVRKPFALDFIYVETSSSLADLEAEKRMLNDRIISGLRESQLFKGVSGDKTDVNPGSGIEIHADIKEIKKVSEDRRLWAGALAGKARVSVKVTASDLNAGNPMETFEVEGESSGGSALAGNTEEAMVRAAEQVVREVIKINALTAQ
jgi:hypothetical protein